MQLFKDAIEFIKTLSYIDFIFFFAVLALMLLIITFIYFLMENTNEDNNEKKTVDDKKESNIITDDEDDAITDLRNITEALEEKNNNAVRLNNYEIEQEEKAIISYDELIKRKNDYAINYVEEENINDDLNVKKVDLDNLVNKEIVEKPDIKVAVISYEKEEAFLKALKTLQQNIN